MSKKDLFVWEVILRLHRIHEFCEILNTSSKIQRKIIEEYRSNHEKIAEGIKKIPQN